MKKEEIVQDLKIKIEDFIKDNQNWIIILRWPTASGKSSISVQIAKLLKNIEIISADSRQVYKYMDIWTDKIDLSTRNEINHYQIDLVNPDQIYTLWNWKESTLNLINEIQLKSNIPMIVGWTWLYIDSIYKNFSVPEVAPDYDLRDKLQKKEDKSPWFLHKKLFSIDTDSAKNLHPNSNRHIIRALEIYEKTWKTKSELWKERKTDFPILFVWLWPWKEKTNYLIDLRVENMFKKWLLEEVSNLLNMWYNKNLLSMKGIWYKEVIEYLEGNISLDDSIDWVKRATHQYAKRQRTWFRRYVNDKKTNPKKDVFYLNYIL